jgi:hypothetical protein
MTHRAMIVTFGLAMAWGHTSMIAPAFGDDAPQFKNCGITSLYLLLELSGKPTDLSVIERMLPSHTTQGYSLAELQAAAHRRGLSVRGVRLRRSDLPLDRPVIAYMRGPHTGHFVVLRPVGTTGTMVQIFDPPSPPRVLDYDRLLHHPGWTVRLLMPQTTYEQLTPYVWIVLTILPVLCAIAAGRKFIAPRVRTIATMPRPAPRPPQALRSTPTR